MIIYPKKLNQYCPSSLAAIILATIAAVVFKLPIDNVGEIPKSLFLENRLQLSGINLDQIQNLLIPAVSIAALGLIESLLCGTSAGRMKNEKMNAGQELIAQGIGNIIIPFFGGVPATAAIARTSVAISSGAQTRLTSIFHAIVLLLSMFALGGVMSAIPLSALAGVLIVTAWRMNEWEVIKDIFDKKLKTSISKFLITMAATVIFDLTIAIIIGVFFSIVMFVIKVSDMQINVSDIEPSKLKDKSLYNDNHRRACVIYITGPLYFGTANKLEEKLSSLIEKDILIFSMRGVPLADISGVKVLEDLCLRLSGQEKAVYFTCIQPAVMEMFERCGMKEYIGEDKFFWSTDKVLSKLSKAPIGKIDIKR
jgi:SulP family sulfate permease